VQLTILPEIVKQQTDLISLYNWAFFSPEKPSYLLSDLRWQKPERKKPFQPSLLYLINHQ
jgi:hypothetical protein